MRCILPLALILGACSQQQTTDSTVATGNFAGEGRDRLCISGDAGSYRAGLISYGQGNINCSVSGRLELQDGQWTLIPRGEGPCQIPLVIEGNAVHIGEVPASCSYYCGPGAMMGEKTYNRTDMGATAVDLAGDPLC